MTGRHVWQRGITHPTGMHSYSEVVSVTRVTSCFVLSIKEYFICPCVHA